MVFSSPVFLFLFLPITLILYYISPSKIRNYILLFMSLLFYAWGEPKLVILMIISIVINYVLALFMSGSSSGHVRKALMIAAVVCDLGFLFYFKYFNFFISTVERVSGLSLELDKIALPIGISFYTFQIMSYVIDVYRNDAKPQRNPFNLALYISLFPQLIAGPIVRYTDVEKQIASRRLTSDRFYEGALRFMKGFSKKVLIADRLAPFVDSVFVEPCGSASVSWIAVVAYTLQIYYDFSGYSDMAIGLGKMLGFDFVENFNFPYISCSVKEFWRRWHISLSTWFRDYVYIPLGGSRKGTGRTYVNLMIVFVLTGFWHGASWNFLCWGLYYAVFLIAERLFLGKALEKTPSVLRHIYTLIVVMLGWVMFRADGMQNALKFYKGMFMIGDGEYVSILKYLTPFYALVILIGILFAFPHTHIQNALRKLKCYEFLRSVAFTALFLLAIMFMTGTGFSPFLYFRF